jgi:hypothetical protein
VSEEPSIVLYDDRNDLQNAPNATLIQFFVQVTSYNSSSQKEVQKRLDPKLL